MKFIFSVITLLCIICSHAQKPNLAKEFQPGSVTFPDSTTVNGEVKWFPHQNEKLKFRSPDGKTEKYAPGQIVCFHADTAEFRSLFNFEVAAGKFPLTGKYKTINSSFGRFLGGTRFEVYLVIIADTSPLGTGIENYINFIFRDTKDSSVGLVPYPSLVRMKDKMLDKAKERLLPLFAEFPEMAEKLKQLEPGAEYQFAKEVTLLK